MSQARVRRSRLLLAVIGLPLGILLGALPAELALRLISVFSSATRYLSTGREGASRRRYASLQEYLATRTGHVVPHRRWFNYWANALGLNDEEFIVPKPAGRFRVMAVGDSFTYGLVPYPQNVMTLLEASLRAACPDRDLDLLNFGIGGTNATDYRTIIELGYAAYEPDLVLVNFYAGNDGPDLYRQDREGVIAALACSGTRTSGTTSATSSCVRRSVPDAGALAASVQGPASAGPAAGERPRGGQVIDPGLRLRDDAPALVGPIFDEKVFAELLAVELGRFYVPPDARAIGRAWRTATGAARSRPCPRGGTRRPARDHPLPVGSAGGRTISAPRRSATCGAGGPTPRSGPTASIPDCRIGPCSRTAVSAVSPASI